MKIKYHSDKILNTKKVKERLNLTHLLSIIRDSKRMLLFSLCIFMNKMKDEDLFLAKHHLLLKIIKSSNDSNSWKIIRNEERN